jgi:hypothetical protein
MARTLSEVMSTLSPEHRTRINAAVDDSMRSYPYVECSCGRIQLEPVDAGDCIDCKKPLSVAVPSTYDAWVNQRNQRR